MGDSKGPVYFFMPDGTKISNDQNFRNQEAQARMQAEAEQSTPEEPTPEEPTPEEPTPEEPTPEEPTPEEPTPEEPTPEEPNSADNADGENEGEDQGDGLDEMTADQLKERVKELRDQGVEVNTAGVKKKQELIDAIRAAQA